MAFRMAKRPACGVAESEPIVRPPVLPEEAWSAVEHGRVRRDPYHWMERPGDPRVRAYLEANNRHVDSALAGLADLRARLEAEMRARLPPNEGQAPWRLGDHWYALRYAPGREHPVFTRRPGSPDGPEEVLIDGPALARGHAVFHLDAIQVSPDGRRLLFAADTTGARLYTLYTLDMGAGRPPRAEVAGVEPLAAWSADGQSFVYVRPDPATLRPCRVCLHRLGTDPAADARIYEEKDGAFRCYVTATRSERHILVYAYSANTEELWTLDATRPAGPLRLVCPRAAGCEVEGDHDGHVFVLRTNHGVEDGRICETAAGAGPADWAETAAGSAGTLIEKAAVFRRHLLLLEFHDGRPRVRVVERATGESHEVRLPDPVFHAWADANPGADRQVARLGYTSLVTPVTYYDYDLERRTLRMVAREAPAGYEPAAYETRLERVRARDGAEIPVTLAGRRDVLARGGAPLLLFGYGAYGTNMPATFDEARLSLLERGFIYGMAHVRGGSERGRAWYRAGRLRDKPRSAWDFEDAAEHLARTGLACRERMFAETLSAGGLMLGDVLNRRPDLFRGAVLREPFVDLLNAMADPDRPWTQFEYGEWGDPADPADWAVMRAYSPYENMRRQAYPHVLATAGMYDAQVPCWEPAKWVARLRAHHDGPACPLLWTHLRAGHGGSTGRLARLRDQAMIAAWLLELAGLA